MSIMADDEIVRASTPMTFLDDVRAISETVVELKFRGSAEWKALDLTALIERDHLFVALNDPQEFTGVNLVAPGGGIEWPCGADLSASTLHNMVDAKEPWCSRDFIDWMDRLQLSNQDAADALSLSLRRIGQYRSQDDVFISLATKDSAKALEQDPMQLYARLRAKKQRGRPKKKGQRGVVR